MGIGFLGRLPLDGAVSTAGETGVPLLLGNAENSVLDVFRQVAGNVAAAVSVLTAIP